jgi:hypothetical protein
MQSEARSRVPIQSVESMETLGDRLCRSGRYGTPVRLAWRGICRTGVFSALGKRGTEDRPQCELAPVWSGKLCRQMVRRFIRRLVGSAQAYSTEIEPAS